MPDIMNTGALQEKLIQLRNQYRQSFADKKTVLNISWQNLCSDKEIKASIKNLYNLLHNLSGTGSTFGFFQITEQAKILENLMKSMLNLELPLNSEQKDQINILINTLADELDNPVEQEYLHTPEKYRETASGTNHLIYLVDDDILLSENLSVQLSNAGYRVKTYLTPELIFTEDKQDVPDLIIMDMVFSDAEITGAEVVSRYRSELKADIPVIFVSVRDDLEARLSAVRSGCSYYLLKPVESEHLLRVLDILLNRDRKIPPRALIIDDDEIILSYYKMVLNGAGIEAEGVTHPLQALGQIREFNPEIILMDVNMPYCNGIELSSIIRQYRQFMTIPIVFLTTETNFNIRNTATDIGADDYLLKPISPAQLIRVTNSRAKRFRQLNDLTEELAEIEKNTRNLMENVHDVIWSSQPDGTSLTFISPSCTLVIGKSPEMLIQSSNWRDFIFTDDSIYVESELRKLDEKEHVEVVYRILMPDFNIRWVSESIRKIKNTEGRVVRLDGTICDITARELDKQIIKRRMTLENELSVFTKALLQNRDINLAFDCLSRMTGAKVIQLYKEVPTESGREKYNNVFHIDIAPETSLLVEYLDVAHNVPWLKELKKGNHIFSSEIHEKLPISSPYLLLPVFVQHHWFGFVSFCMDDNNQHNTSEELAFVKSASDILSIYLEKEKIASEKTKQDKLLEYAGRISRSLLLESGFVSALRVSLNLLKEASQYEEVYLLQFIENESRFVLIAQSNTDVKSLIEDHLINSINQHFGLWKETLSRKHSVIMDYKSIHENLQFPKAVLLNHLIIVPVCPSSSLWGIIVFASDHTEHHLTTRHIHILESVADSFGGALIRQQTHDELITAKSLAEQANKSKSEFLANMSHEIRTPMNAIMGFAQVLKHNSNSDERQEYIELILDSGTKLLSLITDVLDLANVDIGKTYVQKGPVAIQFLVPPVWNKFASELANKGLEPRLDIDQAIPILMTDQDKLTKLIKCLVSNAIKFTETGFVSLCITYQDLHNESINLIVEVEDSGIGIDPSKQSVIFDAFEQADNSKTRRYSGIGLGLTLSSKIVKILGGKIELESSAGKGSLFRLSIPTQIAEIEREEILDEIPSPPKPIKILVAEDNRINRILVSKIFDKTSYELHMVENGQDTVDFLLQHPDTRLVLMDVHMPVLTGIEATKIIKSHPDIQHVKIVALTASVLQEDISLCYQAGMDDFLEKPLQTDKLFNILRKWCT